VLGAVHRLMGLGGSLFGGLGPGPDEAHGLAGAAEGDPVVAGEPFPGDAGLEGRAAATLQPRDEDAPRARAVLALSGNEQRTDDECGERPEERAQEHVAYVLD